ncbi:MAG TPA: histidine--tRNA ligase [Candidatus Deferrimicrobiaceae bacterium]|nr:histidine--tRNA ligase [Candidatus Deferrimicrobiaceae bacterium]
MTIPSVRGMKDILPPVSARWAALEAAFRDRALRFGFSEIRTPVLEKTELFARSVGETTDIVEKEMYTFLDRSGESLTMRPEGTAPVVRALQANRGTFSEWPVRLFYTGPMFRHERPQKGRLRQFHQFGAELFGTDSPFADAEMITFLHGFLEETGLRGISLEINSLGDPGCRPAYHGKLSAFLSSREERLCEDCRRRRAQNPLRVLDCKSEGCLRATADAPSVLESLCGPCREHFGAVEGALRASGISFTRNPRMVRGLDYYRRTTFEFVIPGMGAQNAVAAGGRYDGLAEMLGGRERIPAIGFALGVERVLMLLGEGGSPVPATEVFLVTSGSRFLSEAFRWKLELIGRGIRAEMDYEGRSVKSQFRRADRAGARFVVVFGESEAERGAVVFRDMAAGAQEELPKEEAIRRLNRLGDEKGE